MLELVGSPGYETISKPSEYVMRWVDTKIAELGAINFGELGVGIGATTLAVAEKMSGKGEMHLFDFERRVDELARDLKDRGFDNITTYSNTERHWDSYHWNLSKLIREGKGEFFDVIYIDGAHTYLHDALAFFMCDRLLKVGGILVFDDWYWAFANSKWMADTRDQFMTEEQAEALQIKMFLEELVNDHVGYKEVEKLTVYRKIAGTSRTSTNVFSGSKTGSFVKRLFSR
ncbi:MAG: class I SAM-dependent methyltransferase [Pseudomonadota bacterium]